MMEEQMQLVLKWIMEHMWPREKLIILFLLLLNGQAALQIVNNTLLYFNNYTNKK